MSGGLCNQLFQYAAGWSLAKRLGVGLRIDTRFYTEYEGPRSFRLSMFPISAEVIHYDRRGLFSAHGALYRAKRFMWDKWVHDTYIEPRFGFDANFFELPDGVWISGLFQSYRYINLCDELKDELSLSGLVSSRVTNVDYSPYISVHVRRGDYMDIPGFFMERFDQYYPEAMYRAAQMFDSERFLVFSDDIEWCKSQSIFKKCEFFDNHDFNDIDALYAMGKCRGHIIANSSFSLWAALMGGRGGVAPLTWLNGVSTKGAEIVPQEKWVIV